jgi:hypothetical protein
MSNLGAISFYLGMTITWDRPNRTLRLRQYSYIIKVLRDFGIEDYKLAVTLIDINRSNLVPVLKDYLVSLFEIKEY